MNDIIAIGLDPDSRNSVAAFIHGGRAKPTYRTFSLSKEGIQSLVEIILSNPGAIVGVEGKHGQSTPLEKAFHSCGISFYSVPAEKVQDYRKGSISKGKNNEKDAYSVARYVLDQKNAGTLDAFVQKEDYPSYRQLRNLSRFYTSLSHQRTRLLNQLWKELKEYANPLYLSMSDREKPGQAKIDSKRFLELIATEPELSDWSGFSKEDFLEKSGGQKLKGWEEFLDRVQTGAADLSFVPAEGQLMLRMTADQLLYMRKYLDETEKLLRELEGQDDLASYLMDKFKGLGPVNAAIILGEIGDISRFPDNDHLASYTGLTRVEKSTGDNKRQTRFKGYNHSLKNGFVNFTKAYLRCNKESHIFHYHRFLVKKGVKKLPALVRTTRALLRKVYKVICEYLKEHQRTVKKRRERMAEGQANLPLSNISLPPFSIIHQKEDAQNLSGYS